MVVGFSSYVEQSEGLVASQHNPVSPTYVDDGLVAAQMFLKDPDFAEYAGRREDWQNRAWVLYEHLSHVNFAVEFFGNALSQAGLVLRERLDDGRLVDVEDPQVSNIFQGLLAGLRGARHSLREQIRLWVVNLLVAGEFYLVSKKTDKNRQVFLTVTSESLVSEGFGDRKRVGVKSNVVPGGVEWFDSGATVLRVFKPNPRHPDRAFSSVAGVLTDGEILLALNKVLKALSSSRLNAGLLLVPKELDYGLNMAAAAHDPGGGATAGFEKILYEIMSAPISDETSAAAIVPILMKMPYQHLEHVKHFDLGRKFDEVLPKLIEQRVSSIAAGLDMPASILLGQQDSNHWSAWQQSAEFVRSHARPMLSLITDFLTSGLLHPALVKENVAGFERFCFWFDETQLVVQPNRTANALDAYKLGALSTEAFLAYLGFDPVADISADPSAPGTPRTSEGVSPDRLPSVRQRGESGETSPRVE